MKVINPPYNHDSKPMGWGVICETNFYKFFDATSQHFSTCSQNICTRNVTFLKEIEDNKNRPGTKIYLERQKNEEVVCSPAEQGDAESWVVFCPEARAAC